MYRNEVLKNYEEMEKGVYWAPTTFVTMGAASAVGCCFIDPFTHAPFRSPLY